MAGARTEEPGMLKTITRQAVPAQIRLPIQRCWRSLFRWWYLATGTCRLRPISILYGSDRGQCIDRFYIEEFLARNSKDIRGRVLEIADNTYTLRFGAQRVLQSDILHAAQGNPRATLVGDLTRPEDFASDVLGRFDCLLLTQTFPFIYDTSAAVRGRCQLLAPEGVLLATVLCALARSAVTTLIGGGTTGDLRCSPQIAFVLNILTRPTCPWNRTATLQLLVRSSRGSRSKILA